jgi:hypothetical protein
MSLQMRHQGYEIADNCSAFPFVRRLSLFYEYKAEMKVLALNTLLFLLTSRWVGAKVNQISHVDLTPLWGIDTIQFFLILSNCQR